MKSPLPVRVLGSSLSDLAHLILTVAVAGLLVVGPGTARGQTGWINEFHYDNDGTDLDEFVEIVISTDVPIDLSVLEVILYNGSTGEPYRTGTGLDLTVGASTDHYALYVWHPSDVQNGHDGIALGYDGRVLDFVSYEGAFTGTTGLAAGELAEDVGTAETTTTPIGSSIQRTGSGGSGTDFDWTGPTTASAGLLNGGQTLASVPLTLTPGENLVVADDTLSLNVSVGTSTHPVTDLVGAGFQIRYDPALLAYLSYELGSFLSSDPLVFEHDDPTEGVLAFSVTEKAPTSGSSGTGTIVSFDFLVSGPIQTDTTVRLQPEEILATDLAGTPIPLVPLATELTLSTGPGLGLPLDTLDFGLVDVATGADTVIYVHNTGGMTLNVTDITVDRADYAVGSSSVQVLPGDSQAVSVEFAPATADTITGSLTITSTDADTPVRSVLLTGIAAPFVWPGDTDNDGTVDVIDVLPLGQHFGLQGPARGFGLAWLARVAGAWSPLEATYADGTGDGVVDQNDLQPIGFNYGQNRTAAKTRTGEARSKLRFGEHDRADAIEELAIWARALGDTIPLTVSVPLHRSQDPWLGVAAVLTYDSRALELLSVRPDSSFDDGTLLELVRHDRSRGLLALAYTRLRTGTPVRGGGPAVHLLFRPNGGESPPAPIHLVRSALGTPDRIDRGVVLDLETRLPVPNPALPELPSTFRLTGAYPNPFNPSARIRFDLPEPSEVSVAVYDLLGRRVRTVGPHPLEAGHRRTVPIDATGWPTGTYLYVLRARGTGASGSLYTGTGRMTLLR